MIFDWQIAGAFAFGLVLGWNLYFVNRYRSGDIGFGDIVTLIGAVGGAAVLALFPVRTDLFGAYGVGLAVGFFLYLAMLTAMVRISPNFDTDWFLDGRRVNPGENQGYGTATRPTLTPMAPDPARFEAAAPATPAVSIAFHGVNPGELAAIPAPQLAAPNPDATRIQQTCAAVYGESGPQGAFKNACNFYLIEVADRLGIALQGRADEIIDMVESSPSWTELANGPAAKTAAENGKLVIAGVKSDVYSPPRSEGHVAVVTPGAMNPAGWAPAGYWGSTDPGIARLGGSGIPISNCFTAAVKDAIVYRCRDI